MIDHTALLMVRRLPHYRHQSFKTGLERLGYRVTFDITKTADLVVMWNRNQANEMIARRHEQAGKPVIITENGYIGVDPQGNHLFALSLNHHNGAGSYPDNEGNADRWETLGIDVKPWRTAGVDLVMLPQRGIGPVGVGMPRNWLNVCGKRLTVMSRSVRVRLHPGTQRNPRPLEDDLKNAHAVVTWGSSAAIKAMIAGVPCYYQFPKWIGGSAGLILGDDVSAPLMDDCARHAMLHRIAYAQWTAAEIESSEALARVLSCGR